MPGPLLFQGASEIAVLSNTFLVGGVPVDPDTVSCTVTDPGGVVVTHSYLGGSPADVSRTGTGAYQLLVPCVTAGIWAYVWAGTGAAADVTPGSFTVNPVAMAANYTSVEEMKDRLGITDVTSDMTLTRVVRSASRAVDRHCGRHFFPMADTRTYVPYSIWELPVDDVVSVTQLAVDQNGFGVFDQVWVQGVDYELGTGRWEFNTLATGEPRPYTEIRVINAAGGGRFFPWTWPFSRLDRVQVQGVFGWPAVPDDVHEATILIATDLYKRKDAPFGVIGVQGGGAGIGYDYGAIKVPKINPGALHLLADYRGRREVAV